MPKLRLDHARGQTAGPPWPRAPTPRTWTCSDGVRRPAGQSFAASAMGRVSAPPTADILSMSPLTAFGLFAVTAMLVCYALERRSPWWVLGFAISCWLGSTYGFLQGAWP